MPTAEEPLRAAANDGDRLFTVETHPSPGGPSAKGFTRIKRIRATELITGIGLSSSSKSTPCGTSSKRGLPNSKLPASRTLTEAGNAKASNANFGVSNLKGYEFNHRLIHEIGVPCPMCPPRRSRLRPAPAGALRYELQLLIYTPQFL
jgi:hypothetical protein